MRTSRAAAVLSVFAVLLTGTRQAPQDRDVSNSEEPPGTGEVYFNGTAFLKLGSFVSVHRLSGLSFRTCEEGTLFYQRMGSDSISLKVNQDGLLFVAIINQRRYEGRLNARLLDNNWYNVVLVYRLGNLTLSAAGNMQVIANATYNSEILALPDQNVNSTLIVGENFRGCILQGPGILFNDTVNSNAVFGPCPIDTKGCSSSASSAPFSSLSSATTDHCPPEQCMMHGKCVSRQDRYECHCYARYSGTNCQTDHGPPCASSPCRNGGSCLEDEKGDYRCLCNPGYGGFHCESQAGTRVCDLIPCKNNALCIELSENDYKCECQPGWTGKNCEVDYNECSSNPCHNGGNCTDGLGEYTCRCDRTGYTGTNCEVDIDECEKNNPCLNRGECYNNYGGYICACPNGFEGQNCELNLNECLSNPCSNGGVCIDTVGSYHCNCAAGFAGPHCDLISGCENAACPANSICMRDSHGLQCVCKPGFVGNPPNCTINYCASNPCSNGGTCTSLKDRFNCTCPPEWKGKNCQINVNECLSQPCQNGGTCIDRVNGYICNCTRDFMGENCEREFDACALNPCMNNGTCNLMSRSKRDFVCDCPRGFEGKVCNIDVDECANVSCPDGKVCFDGIDSYECKCQEGYTGPNCTIALDPCAKNPCNNGTCIDLGNQNYNCQCFSGFGGKHCDKDIDECKVGGNSLCNHGICVNNVGSYNCYCQPGYSGDHCDIDIDECLCGPCKNNATCIDRINTFECRCPPGYTGKTCELDVNECESDPCQNGATCIDQIATYNCICSPGFTGYNCETNINDCESQPCQNNGECIDKVNAYSCNCTDTGFDGDHCENNIDDCVSNQCTNGATCIDEIKSYKCQCYPGYTGSRCETDINECESSPCQFNGTCLERSNEGLYKSDALNKPAIFMQPFNYANASGYECLCVQGVTGKNCEVNINECESNPCISGTCVDRIGGYKCDCDEGFEGELCQIDINECLKYKPCVHGSCTDGRADYYCACERGYGGKNCSVALKGCQGNACKNGGTCIPYLVNETEHRFNCTCPNGFHGEICDYTTTLSLNGRSFVTANTTREEGYDIQFRFQTTLADGLLAMGTGPTFYLLELFGGKLNLRSSLLNKWEGVFIGAGLNDSNWQKVFVAINATHLVLSANDEQTIYPITINEASNTTHTSFPTTYVGGTIPSLRNLVRGSSFFTGCTEDVIVNGEWIYSESKNVEMDGAKLGCPRAPQCSPNPCQNGGECADQWLEFSCKCQRPYLGHTCQYNMTAATFGHENITNGYVTVKVADSARRAVRSIVDISMFIRTRQEVGDIFYLGSEPESKHPADETYIAAQLDGGELRVRIQFNGTEAYTVGGVPLNNGNSHLIQVVRNLTLIQVKINGTEYFRKTISATGQLNVTILYLGGLPQASRYIRQVDSRQIEVPQVVQAPQVNFKGIIQDVQISNGSNTMFVEFYPLIDVLKAKDIPALTQFGNVTFDSDKVLKGVVSDNVCVSNPCFHNGTCEVTWNDFTCQCPRGYSGKTCQEMEFCQLQDCPAGSKCQNLDAGYECIANATFDGISTAFTYFYTRPAKKNLSETIETIRITYRSNTGGTLLYMAPKTGHQYFTVTVNADAITVSWKLSINVYGVLTLSKSNADGNWTSIILKLKNNSLECGYANENEDSTQPISHNFNFALWYELLTTGSVTLGGISNIPSGRNYVSIGSERHFENRDIGGNSVDFEDRKLTTPMPPQSTIAGEAFKGCLGEVRIGSMLLHYFTYEEVYQNANFTPLEFLSLQRNNATNSMKDIGCRLCFDRDCKNNGHCLDKFNSYICSCLPGYKEDDCSVNIDECADNKCVNGATCIDGIANFTCACKEGWTGWLCEQDIDECQTKGRCQNGGTCTNEPGSYRCDCPEKYTGKDCDIVKLVTCENQPCENGSTCSDEKNFKTGDNFTCICQPGYVGNTCRSLFCELQPCENGGKCNADFGIPNCACEPGYNGTFCEVDIDDCQPTIDGPPCKHGGKCQDGVNSFSCDCTGTGYEGSDCGIDVDECKDITTKCGNGTCVNTEGSYRCQCDLHFCGHDCTMEDPCQEEYCQNGGSCSCDPNTGQYLCLCAPNFIGQNCTESEHFLGSQALDIAVIVGPIVGVVFLIAAGSLIALFMMARKKRATRGTYSPSAQEFSNPRVEMDNVMKPPPEERLI